jgi:signal transduction histidine kinase
MSVESILYSISILGIALTGIAVLLSKKRPVFICFSIFSFSLSAWLISQYFIDHNIELKFWIGFSLIALEIIAACFCLFAYVYPDRKMLAQKYWIVLLLPLIVFGPLSFSNLLVKNAVSSQTLQFGPLYYPQTLIVLAYIIGGLLLVFLRYKKMTAIEKNQSAVLFAAIIPFLLASIITGTLLANSEGWQVLRPLTAFIMVAIILYAIITRHLFDMHLVIVRALAYTLLLSALGAAYALGAFAIGGDLFKGTDTSLAQEIYNTAVAIVLAFTFQPLRRFFQIGTDSIFYRDHYNSEYLLNNLGSIMSREIELNPLTTKVIRELTGQMKLFKALIVVLDKDKVFYESNTEDFKNQRISLDELTILGPEIVVKDNLEIGTAPLIFNKYDLSVSVALKSSNELVGYLLLGAKKSGDIFNSQDIRTLNILAHELAIAIHNAKSYTEIQNFNKTLQKRIDEATEQLRDANENLKELDQLKNEFLSMATHQLNTPLTVVDGYLTMINDGVVSEPAERKDYIEKTLERVRSMKRMVADFLNVSRIETGKFIIDVKPTDFNKLVSEEVNGLGPSAKDKEVLLQFIPSKHPVPFIEIDEQKTRQAVMNLIDNAIYYTPKGEVKVYMDADGKFVTFRVVDNGIGVPEKQKDKLFQKFYRADNARLERPNGNGVGLFLVKRVVEDQGGKIIFESTEGQGSTFGFRLPIKSNLPINPNVDGQHQKEPVAA